VKPEEPPFGLTVIVYPLRHQAYNVWLFGVVTVVLESTNVPDEVSDWASVYHPLNKVYYTLVVGVGNSPYGEPYVTNLDVGDTEPCPGLKVTVYLGDSQTAYKSTVAPSVEVRFFTLCPLLYSLFPSLLFAQP